MSEFLSKTQNPKQESNTESNPTPKTEPPIDTGAGAEPPDIQKQYTEAVLFEALVEEGEKRTTFSPGWFSILMTHLNLILAFGFDSLLFYTIDPRVPTPDTAGFLVKIILLIVAYFVVNIVLGVFVYSTLIPAYYTFYTARFANFAAYLKKQQNRYQNDSNRRILVGAGDPNTIGTLAFFPTVVDLSGSTINTMDSYNKFLDKMIPATTPNYPDIPTPIQKPLKDFYAKYPTPDSALKSNITGYYKSLPDQFNQYVKGQQQYLYQAIQFWVLMMCTILFVIPIKYTLVDVVVQPKLPDVADIPGMSTAANALGKVGSVLGNAASKITSKVSGATGAASGGPPTPGSAPAPAPAPAT